MLLQTNSYIVPAEKRAEHARLMRRFRQILNRIGCDDFEIYEQVGANWGNGPTSGRYVQIMRFRDRRHQLAVQNAERSDPAAQQLIAEFCELVNYPYQQQQGQFAVGFYSSVLPVGPARSAEPAGDEAAAVAPTEPQELAAEPELEAPTEEGELEAPEPATTEAVEDAVEDAAAAAPAQVDEELTVEETVPSEDALLEDILTDDGGAAQPDEGLAAQDLVHEGEASAAPANGQATEGGECLDSLIGTEETPELELDGGDALSRLAAEFAAENKEPHAPGRGSENGAH
jgi:hypothetical protein